MMKSLLLAGLLTLLSLPAFGADDTPALPPASVAMLRQGGFVIVMRHASSPRALPDAATANADNPRGERQLDARGRDDARAFGEALRRLRIPLGEVLSSPAYRALETGRLAGLAGIEVHPELGNEGMLETDADRGQWLRNRVLRGAATGNTLIITHGPNIDAAFADYARGMEEGEALVLDPRNAPASLLLARIRIDAWSGY